MLYHANKNEMSIKKLKQLPHDTEMEQSILGSILIDEESTNIVITKLLSEDYFYSLIHQNIYRVILKLFGLHKNIDVFSIADILRSENKLDDIGGEEYLIELQQKIISTAHLEQWCEILINLYLIRKMISTCTNSIDDCYNASIDNIQSIFSDIENNIFKVRDVAVNGGMDFLNISKYIKDTVEHLEKLSGPKNEDVFGLSTGFPDVDRMILGMRRQELIVVAARPSIGKTSLALNIALNVIRNSKKNVAFFSLEMSAEQVVKRIICSMAEVSENSFYDKSADLSSDWAKIVSAGDELQKMTFFIDPSSRLSINELTAKALRLKARHQIDLLFIDYLQLMHADIHRNDNRQIEVSTISAGLKSLAKELNIPIFVVAQLNRQAEQSEQPRLSHLRESGSIEQDADIVMLLHRDRDSQKDVETESVSAKLIIEKNRNGKTGVVDLLFFPKITTFSNESRYSDSDYN